MAKKDKDKKKLAARSGKGLKVASSKGLNEKRMASSSGQMWEIRIKQGETAEVQFGTNPGDFREFDRHSWSEGKGKKLSWFFVPCAGEGCPLCDDSDPEISKTSYVFAAPVYSFDEKAPRILTGPKTLAQMIDKMSKNKRTGGKKFQKITFDVSKQKTQPVTYFVQQGDSKPVDMDRQKMLDLDEYLAAQMKRFYGDETSDKRKDSLDDDAQDDSFSKKELKGMKPKELRKAASAVGAKVKDSMDDSEIIDAILAKQDDGGDKKSEKGDSKKAKGDSKKAKGKKKK